MNDSQHNAADPSYVDLEAHMVRLGRIRKKKHTRKRDDSRWPRRRRRW
jgi:hypothetical protein